MFSKGFIQKINNISIYDIVSKYVELKKSNSNLYIGKCPSPNHKDNDPSFRVWIKENSWACMTCHCGKKDKRFNNYGSDPVAFIMWVEKKSFKEAVFYLANMYGIEIPTDKNEALYKNRKMLCNCYRQGLTEKPLKYLYERGLDDYDIDKYLLGFDGRKIIFPLMDKYGQIIAFTKRWLNAPENAKDKYKNSSNSDIFKKGKYFYGLNNIIDDFEEVRITEGPMDVILADKYGLKNIICTLGTSFTDEHADIIKHLNKVPVFIFDGDKAGTEAIDRACIKMADRGVYSKLLILNDKKDLADYSLEVKHNIENIVSTNSLTYGTYLIQNDIMTYKSKVLEMNMAFEKKFQETLYKVPLLTERQALQKMIKTELGI